MARSGNLLEYMEWKERSKRRFEILIRVYVFGAVLLAPLFSLNILLLVLPIKKIDQRDQSIKSYFYV